MATRLEQRASGATEFGRIRGEHLGRDARPNSGEFGYATRSRLYARHLASEMAGRYDTPVNYFAHGLRFLNRPHFLAGTAVPDWLSVADRGVRVRPKLVEPLLGGDVGPGSDVAAGILQHFHDDQWFHATRGFAEVSRWLTRLFRETLGYDEDLRAGFLGHIVTEMLLDAVLIERDPRALDEYYAALDRVDPDCVQGIVNRAAKNTTERLAPLILLFSRERFLYDYRSPSRLLYRLNQVMRRVKLQLLPEAVIGVLESGREMVARRVDDLLPPQYFAL
jgi:hypothetical protein